MLKFLLRQVFYFKQNIKLIDTGKLFEPIMLLISLRFVIAFLRQNKFYKLFTCAPVDEYGDPVLRSEHVGVRHDSELNQIVISVALKFCSPRCGRT